MNLKQLSKKIAHKDHELFALQKTYLKEAFLQNKTYGFPSWLDNIFIFSAVFGEVWVDYRHDGAWVMPHSIKGEIAEGESTRFSISGLENMEYMQDYVTDIVCYDIPHVYYFVQTFIDRDYLGEVEKVRKRILSMSEQRWKKKQAEEPEWFETWLEENTSFPLDFGHELNLQDVWDWAHEK